MRSTKLRRFLLVLILIILSPVLLLEGISIYSYIRFATQPSATEQLLIFAELPEDTKLPTSDPKGPNAYNTDYQQVEKELIQRYPPGTLRPEIEQLTKNQQCTAGAEGIICSFEGVLYAPGSSMYFSPLGFLTTCSDTVYTTFSFDSQNKLVGIEIAGATNCI